MNRASILLASIISVVFIAGGVALAAEIIGTDGDDTLTGTLQADTIFGHGGNDSITARAGADTLWGGTGSDLLVGEGHSDTLHGEGGDDTLRGGNEDDELRGGDGVDTLTGNDGNDTLIDRSGNTAERDSFACGPGQDTVTSDATDIVNDTCEIVNPDVGGGTGINGTDGDDTLTGTLRADTIFGYGGNDSITARAGADTLWGGTGSDVLKGESHNDTLHGEGGDDTLQGGSEDDELRGGDGVDTLTGNDGNDTLIDRSGNTAERDSFACGPGQDTVTSDATDSVNGTCEIVNPGGGGAVDLLPDLGMAPIQNIQIQPGGQVAGEPTDAQDKLLRFSTMIVNVGDGDFEITGRRPNTTTTDMATTQRIYDSAGGFRDHSTDATFIYAGDGHNHWHVRDLEDYTLLSSGDGGSLVAGQGQKWGFCFFDNVEYGAEPGTEKYGPGCSNGQPNLLAVTMGLQRGWGDLYFQSTTGQYIDITGVPDGDYRLRVEADGSDRFLEKDETNNVTWVDLRITGSTVEVLAYGPSSPPIG